MADTMQWLDTWNDAMTSLQLLQIDPSGFGGIVVRAPYGPVRAQWLQQLGTMGLSITKLPGHLDRERLLGGIDLSATLQQGQLRWQAGLLAQADGGVVCIPMAERFPDALTAPLVQTLDTRSLPDGDHHRTAFGVVALDESDAVRPRSIRRYGSVWACGLICTTSRRPTSLDRLGSPSHRWTYACPRQRARPCVRRYRGSR